MIEISKREKEAIRNELPDVHIVRTMKQKSKRHHYYCEENAQVMCIVNQLRGNHVGPKDGVCYGTRKKSR